jgi:hypothetical protein
MLAVLAPDQPPPHEGQGVMLFATGIVEGA